MELRWLEDFIALCETLNFSRAAEIRNITQPAFSRRIRALETWVGAPLVERTTHSVTLTPSGDHFRSHARAICFSLTQAKREAAELAKTGSASLNIAATHALSFTFIPEWLRHQNEEIALGPLNLVSDSMQACENLMLRGETDFLIAHAQPDAPDAPSNRNGLQPSLFQSCVIGHECLLAVISPSLADTSQASTAPAPYLAYSMESGLGRIIAASDTKDAISQQGTANFTSHLAATLQSMVKSGAGFAWLPESLIARDLESGQLRPFRVGEHPIPSIPLEIRITRPRHRLSPLAERLWAHITRHKETRSPH
jgi:DNA-binding transcriptional LysR family regulator